MIETTGGMINAIGLQNVGVDAFVATKLNAFSHPPGCALIANVFGYEVADYLSVIEVLNSGRRHCRLRDQCFLPEHRRMAAWSSAPILRCWLIWSRSDKKGQPAAHSSSSSRPT